MATIREIDCEVDGATAVTLPSTSMSKKRKTSANEQTKIDLLERRLMGADVASIDLTGLMDDDDDDAFDAYRLALVTSQFTIGGETPTSGSAICINECTAPRLVSDPTCPVFLYSPPKETDIWSAIVQRAESSQISKHWEDFPKGIAYEITSMKKIVSERYNSENYAVVLNEKYSTFLPIRFTPFIGEMGAEQFLKSRPHVIYFGKNPTNNAYVILLYPFEHLKLKSTWKTIMEYGMKYIKF